MERINSNLLLCIFSLLFFIIIMKYNFNKETFQNNIKVYPYNIIPHLNEKSFIGTFIPKKGTNYNGNLIITNSLKSNKWDSKISNSMPEDKTIIVDLCYNNDKRLMCVAVKKDNSHKKYSIFIKENIDIESKWIKLNSDQNIMSIIFDLNNNLSGCHASNGQIYRTNDINGSWFGPINYDIPMQKILFDRDEYMLGIGLLDNKIYKKDEKNWEKSGWDKININSQRVFDMVFDFDGKLIATSYNNIIKQKYPTYLSEFEPYKKSYKVDNVLSFEQIIKYRTGHDDEDLNITNNEKEKLNPNLKEILLYKKKMLKYCKNKNTPSSKINKLLTKTHQQNKTIDEIQELIKKIRNK